ncbi:hypothetical protein PENTCL1PPCAC_13240, partial [Pristionchus entomophagus]
GVARGCRACFSLDVLYDMVVLYPAESDIVQECDKIAVEHAQMGRDVGEVEHLCGRPQGAVQ